MVTINIKVGPTKKKKKNTRILLNCRHHPVFTSIQLTHSLSQIFQMRLPDNAGLGVAAMSYIAVDYLRHLSPTWHSRLQPALWTLLALAAVVRVPSYRHWSAEFRSAIPFIASMLFMLACLLYEALSVRSVTAVLGLDWHR